MSAESTLKRLEAGTIDKSIDAIDAALAYQGDNPRFMKQGELGARTLSSYKGILGAVNERERLQFDREKESRRGDQGSTSA